MAELIHLGASFAALMADWPIWGATPAAGR